jgi:predicted phage tail protein
MKTDLVAVDPKHALDRVAELPVNTWSFTHDPSGNTHLGPTAQDFYQAFELGADDRHIAPLDAAGVALAAIQGLNSKLESTDDALQRSDESLQSENARLAARLEEVEEQNQELAERLANLERVLEAKGGDGKPVLTLKETTPR